MLEFTPTPDDAVDLARALAAARGSDRQGRVYFWLIGLLVAILAGALAGQAGGTAFGDSTRMPRLVGIVVAASAWLVLMKFRPNLRRNWSHRRIDRHARADFRPRGATQVWLDGTGINATTGPVHTHLAWLGIKSVTEVGGNVLVTPRHFGPVLAIPRRIDPAEVDRFAAEVRSHMAQRAQDPGDAWPVVDTPTSRWQYAERSARIAFPVTVPDVQELAARVHARRRLPRELRDRRLIWTGRAVVMSFVLLLSLNQTSWGLTGPSGLGLLLAASAVPAVLAWLAASRSFARGAFARAEAEGQHRLAAGGDWRCVWLDDAGVGQEDAVVVEHAAWPAVELTEGPQHYFLHAPEHFDVVLPRRVPGVDEFVAALRSRLGH